MPLVIFSPNLIKMLDLGPPLVIFSSFCKNVIKMLGLPIVSCFNFLTKFHKNCWLTLVIFVFQFWPTFWKKCWTYHLWFFQFFANIWFLPLVNLFSIWGQNLIQMLDLPLVIFIWFFFSKAWLIAWLAPCDLLAQMDINTGFFFKFRTTILYKCWTCVFSIYNNM